jgi:hypothetical protein
MPFRKLHHLSDLQLQSRINHLSDDLDRLVVDLETALDESERRGCGFGVILSRAAGEYVQALEPAGAA